MCAQLTSEIFSLALVVVKNEDSHDAYVFCLLMSCFYGETPSGRYYRLCIHIICWFILWFLGFNFFQCAEIQGCKKEDNAAYFTHNCAVSSNLI